VPNSAELFRAFGDPAVVGRICAVSGAETSAVPL